MQLVWIIGNGVELRSRATMIRLTLLALLFLVSFANAHKCDSELKKSRDRILANDYVMDPKNPPLNDPLGRTLQKYKNFLGDAFAEFLEKLKSGDLWVDIGTGHALAGKEYVKSNPEGANFIGISVKKPPNYKKFESPRFEYREGWAPEALEGLPKKAKLITDLYGAAAYAEDFAGVLEGALNSLETGGEFFMLLSHFGESTTILHKGKPMEMHFFLSRIDGVVTTTYGVESLHSMTKLDDSKVKVPKLKLVDFKDGAPPKRTYILED